MKKTQILWNESKKNMLSISPYANIFVDRQGRIFCYRETLEKNIMISGMDYKCANELVEYLSVPITEDELRNMFPNEIVDTVIILTHRKDESYFEYISRVSTSKLAKKIKVADLLHNLDITRIKEPTKQDYQRLEKYKKAILYLATH